MTWWHDDMMTWRHCGVLTLRYDEKKVRPDMEAIRREHIKTTWFAWISFTICGHVWVAMSGTELAQLVSWRASVPWKCNRFARIIIRKMCPRRSVVDGCFTLQQDGLTPEAGRLLLVVKVTFMSLSYAAGRIGNSTNTPCLPMAQVTLIRCLDSNVSPC